MAAHACCERLGFETHSPCASAPSLGPRRPSGSHGVTPPRSPHSVAATTRFLTPPLGQAMVRPVLSSYNTPAHFDVCQSANVWTFGRCSCSVPSAVFHAMCCVRARAGPSKVLQPPSTRATRSRAGPMKPLTLPQRGIKSMPGPNLQTIADRSPFVRCSLYETALMQSPRVHPSHVSLHTSALTEPLAVPGPPAATQFRVPPCTPFAHRSPSRCCMKQRGSRHSAPRVRISHVPPHARPLPLPPPRGKPSGESGSGLHLQATADRSPVAGW